MVRALAYQKAIGALDLRSSCGRSSTGKRIALGAEHPGQAPDRAVAADAAAVRTAAFSIDERSAPPGRRPIAAGVASYILIAGTMRTVASDLLRRCRRIRAWAGDGDE